MTTEDILKLLPLEEEEKIRVLNEYEFGTKERKADIELLAWTGYMEWYDERVKENITKEMDLIKKGEGGALDKTLYARALKRTEDELQEELTKGVTDTDLARARVAMKQIMNEIHAVKNAKKTATKKAS